MGGTARHLREIQEAPQHRIDAFVERFLGAEGELRPMLVARPGSVAKWASSSGEQTIAVSSSVKGPPASASMPSDLTRVARATTAQQKPLQCVMLPTIPAAMRVRAARSAAAGRAAARAGEGRAGGVAPGRELLPPLRDRVGDEGRLLREELATVHRAVGDADRDGGRGTVALCRPHPPLYAARLPPAGGSGPARRGS